MALKRYVLVVDDDADMRETLFDIITESGFRVVVAESGARAIEEVGVQPFDFVLVDLTMPGLNGVEAIREIKAIDPYVTAIALTGLDEADSQVSEALEAGADSVLHKPFEIDSILEMLDVDTGDGSIPETIDLANCEIPEGVPQLIPEEMARRYGVVPVRVQDGVLSLAMVDARNLKAVESVQAETGLKVAALQSSLHDVQQRIDRSYRSPEEHDPDSSGALLSSGTTKYGAAQMKPVENVRVVALGENGPPVQRVSGRASTSVRSVDDDAAAVVVAGRKLDFGGRPGQIKVVSLGEEELMTRKASAPLPGSGEGDNGEPGGKEPLAQEATSREAMLESDGFTADTARLAVAWESVPGNGDGGSEQPGEIEPDASAYEVEATEWGEEEATGAWSVGGGVKVFKVPEDEVTDLESPPPTDGSVEGDSEDAVQLTVAAEAPGGSNGDEPGDGEVEVPIGPVKTIELREEAATEVQQPALSDEPVPAADEQETLLREEISAQTMEGVYEVRASGTVTQEREPAAAALDTLFAQAVRDGASDIHIEPLKNQLRARCRISGVLHNVKSLPLSMHAPLISRIKVLAGMNIAERHHSQDGRIAVSVDGESMTFRVSTSNTAWGETAVLHGLNQAAPIASLSELGLQPEALGEYSRLLHSLCGMVVAGGPPGSGRTALLHASIHQFDHEERKVITIEDSIEYRIDGITQLEVDYQKKMTMARLLGSSMRLDPDVVVVGDVRDRETAKAAVQAALTGHLILASVHANDAVDTLFRLIDLGIEPFLLTSALAGAISQRLVRRVCPDCQVLRAVPEEEALAYEREMGEKRESFAHGEGCNHCAHTGYRDRIGIYEVLVVSEVIRRMLLAGASADEIRAQAVREGMVSLRRDGMTKVREGVTTPHEVLRGVSALD